MVMIRSLIIVLLVTVVLSFNDFPGPYCKTRYPRASNGICCNNRLDSCSVPISCKKHKYFLFINELIIKKNFKFKFQQLCVIVMNFATNITILIVVLITKVIAKD